MPTIEQIKAKLAENPERYQTTGEWKSAGMIASLLTTGVEHPNPEPQCNIPATSIQKCNALVGMFDQQPGLLATFSDESLRDIRQAADAGDWKTMLRWAKIGKARQKITAEQLAGIEAIDGLTVPDPDWRPMVVDDPPFMTVSVAEVAAAIAPEPEPLPEVQP